MHAEDNFVISYICCTMGKIGFLLQLLIPLILKGTVSMCVLSLTRI